MDKKIAVHVTNEEQWNEVSNFATGSNMNKSELHQGFRNAVANSKEYGDGSFAMRPDHNIGNNVSWSDIEWYKEHPDEYEILEFNEWKEKIKGDSMEKIEVPQAVYDKFNTLNGVRSTAFSIFIDVWSSDIRDDIWEYIFGSGNKTKQHQLNLAQVMAGEAEFVPIEEAYYWQDNQGMWLVKNVLRNKICLSSDKKAAGKLTETEIREKTSFDIDKLKKVSE